MSTIESTPAVQRQLILKVAFWIFLIVFAARFVIRDALPYFGFSEDVFGRFWDMKWWLTGHITGGLLAIAIGPFQFWPTFRNKYLKVHRILGRFYLGGILLASLFFHWTYLHHSCSNPLDLECSPWITVLCLAGNCIYGIPGDPKKAHQHAQRMDDQKLCRYLWLCTVQMDGRPSLSL